MPNRKRNYMDRLLGRNEGNETRDFSDGRRYGEEQRFYNDEFNDDASEWGRNSEWRRGRGDRGFRSRRPSRDNMDYNPNGTTRGFDYNVRQREDDDNFFRNKEFNSERERGFGRRFDRNDSYTPGNFRNTGRTGIFGRDRSEGRGESRGFFGKGPKGWKRSDERIKDEVSEALYRDYEVDASEIEIEVKEGVVTLSGTVDSRQAKRSAEECIENLSGVIDVHNRIRISEQGNVSNLRSGTDVNDKRALS